MIKVFKGASKRRRGIRDLVRGDWVKREKERVVVTDRHGGVNRGR